MKELWRKMLKSYSLGKENKAARLEYKMLKSKDNLCQSHQKKSRLMD